MFEVEGLTVAYDGGESALTDIDLAVGEGELVTVLGSNGAGETTLLRAISKTDCNPQAELVRRRGLEEVAEAFTSDEAATSDY